MLTSHHHHVQPLPLPSSTSTSLCWTFCLSGHSLFAYKLHCIALHSVSQSKDQTT
ncbi:hypothetical protein L195_g025846, partial [Trifolium pratense]